MQKPAQKFRDAPWFWGFALLHLLIWTALPTLYRFTLPLDAMEGTTWGRQLAWGYDKNPFLNAWLTELGVWIGGQSGWAIYLISQLCIVATFWAVWRLARKFVSPVHALISVFLLELITNYNIDAIDFDDNVLQICFWALIIFFFYQALTSQKIRHWLAVGFFAALALLSKYFVVILFVPMLGVLLTDRQAWKSFFRPGLYLAILLTLLLILPHLIWLFHHDFLTVRYSFMRAATSTNWLSHLRNPWHFGYSYLLGFVLPLMLFLVLLWGRPLGEPIATRRTISSFQWQFLWWLVVGPFLLLLLLSLMTGMALHLGWGEPLMSCWGLFLVALVQPIITKARFYRFIAVGLFLFLVLVLGYSRVTSRAGDTSSANYPGPLMAKQLTEQWHAKYHRPLQYIIGPRWDAGAVSFYSKDRPAVLIRGDDEISFWVDKKALQKAGALVIWDASVGNLKANRIMPQPKMVDVHIEKFPWYRTDGKKFLKIGVGYIPPFGS